MKLECTLCNRTQMRREINGTYQNMEQRKFTDILNNCINDLTSNYHIFVFVKLAEEYRLLVT